MGPILAWAIGLIAILATSGCQGAAHGACRVLPSSCGVGLGKNQARFLSADAVREEDRCLQPHPWHYTALVLALHFLLLERQRTQSFEESSLYPSAWGHLLSGAWGN